MNFDAFLTALNNIQRSIAITSPVSQTIRRTHWGPPAGTVNELPCIINIMSETDRTLGMARRRESVYRISVQALIARATPEDERSGRIATAFWFAAKTAFDSDSTIGGTVTHARLVGAHPTVPVILQHAGQAYIGFDATLEIQQVEVF